MTAIADKFAHEPARFYWAENVPLPDVESGDFVAWRPKRKRFRISPLDISAEDFVELILYNDGLSISTEGVRKQSILHSEL
ncbi:MAG: hypothetical protein KVP17_001186 [Porospora cf. gigantea B]|nr:MAG: hypothetical protein KVP17_001186 [Porospora cf. gigantea B]